MTRHERFTTRALSALLLGASVFFAVPALAESSRVISVEEHWELKTAEPDGNSSAPQTTMVMSPTGDLSGAHFFFTLNHSAVPEYHPGGLQVQLWNGEDFVDQNISEHEESLDHNDETVTWVQRISLADGSLKFEVVDGESETWGHFGGSHLRLTTESTLSSLNGYRPAVSLGESQVSYAENRVTSLTLTKLVWVTEDGVVHEHNAPIPIDTTVGE